MASGNLARVRRPGPLVAASLLYLAAATGLMIWRGISVSPDYVLLLLVPVGLVSGRFLGYLKDWIPFVAILLGWEAMRGIAPKAGFSVHITDLAWLERTVFFGHYPNQILQSLFSASTERTLTLVCTVVYFLHFAFPLAIGMVLWLTNRAYFLRFTTALMGMAFFCFVIYLVAPTAPPWYAAQHGVAVGAHKLSADLPSAISPYYQLLWNLNPNDVAAFPSLHAAFPFLGFLALRQAYPRAAWAAFAWCIVVWFSVIFLGEHWGVDVIAGIATAAATWWFVMHVVVARVTPMQVEQELRAEAAA